MGDPPVCIEGDDVDAVDPDAVDLTLELEHRAVLAAPFAAIDETGAAKDLLRARKILKCDVAPALRCVHHRALEHRIRVQQVPERLVVVRLHVGVPLGETLQGHLLGHGTSPLRRDAPHICTLTHMRLYA